ncbi:MAG: hypothetical protein ACD_23C00587G0002 [uncultured bacterium]|nr:MAG: hypothetical protein ACD_23C00587G0002 [uncultured bacterium]
MDGDFSCIKRAVKRRRSEDFTLHDSLTQGLIRGAEGAQ